VPLSLPWILYNPRRFHPEAGPAQARTPPARVFPQLAVAPTQSAAQTCAARTPRLIYRTPSFSNCTGRWVCPVITISNPAARGFKSSHSNCAERTVAPRSPLPTSVNGKSFRPFRSVHIPTDRNHRRDPSQGIQNFGTAYIAGMHDQLGTSQRGQRFLRATVRVYRKSGRCG